MESKQYNQRLQCRDDTDFTHYHFCLHRSLNDGVFSTMSDVWSFGVLLWEIASFGRLPYGHLDNQEILDEISEGFRLPAPGPW